MKDNTTRDVELDIGVPTENIVLLERLKTGKVSSLIRYSLDSPEQSSLDWNIPTHQVFRLTDGPLVIGLDSGFSIGFTSDPSRASIVLWQEENPDGEDYGEPLCEDEEFYPIVCPNEIYCEHAIESLLGLKIKSVKILRKSPTNSKMAQLPCEAGLVLTFEDNTDIYLSYGLHDVYDDFTVIYREEISEETAENLEAMTVF